MARPAGLEETMKKTLIKILLILLVAGLLLLPGCKKNRFDLRGTWVFTTTLVGQTFEEVYTFQGVIESGNVLWEGQVLGTYSLSGEVFSFSLEYYDQDDDYTVEMYNGSFDHSDAISGDLIFSVEGYQTVAGSFRADR